MGQNEQISIFCGAKFEQVSAGWKHEFATFGTIFAF